MGSWPGHHCFVALLGAEVVIGDRYARDGVTRSYSCRPEDLLEGCFNEQLSEQLGAEVLAEVLAEVRHQLGITDRAEANDPGESVTAEPIAESTAEPESPAEPQPAADLSNATRVRVAVTACPTVDLSLAVALRGLTRAPVAELLPRLRTLPCVIAPDVPRADGESLAQRLRDLGVTVQLSAA